MKKLLLSSFVLAGILNAAPVSNKLVVIDKKIKQKQQNKIKHKSKKRIFVLYKKINYHNSIEYDKRLKILDALNIMLNDSGYILNPLDKETVKKLNERMPYVNFKNESLIKILKTVLKLKNLMYNIDYKNKIINISFYKTKIYNFSFLNSVATASYSAQSAGSNVSSSLKFDIWKKIKTELTQLLKNVNVSFFKEPIVNNNVGTIIVTGTKKQLELTDKYIESLKRKLSKVVLIDFKIFSVQLNNSAELGIDWTKFNASLSATNVPIRAANIFGSASVFNSASFNIGGFLNFLRQKGKVSIVESPKIVTLNGQTATLNIGSTVYYKYASSVVNQPNTTPTTQYTIGQQFVGITLSVTPIIDENRNVTLTISPKITNFLDPNQLNNPSRTMPPDIMERSLYTTVKLKNSNTLVIGGLISKTKSISNNSIPVLSDIPFLGYAFKNKKTVINKKELVFVITPHIIDLKKYTNLNKFFKKFK